MDLNIKTMDLTSLNPAVYNPRVSLQPGDPEFEKLKRSIENFGYVELIVVNTRTGNTVISGHQRLSVLQHMNVKEAECVLVDLDEESEKALNVAMNKVSGSWDNEKLALLISDLNAADFDVSLTGFDKQEIEELLIGSRDDPHEDEFDVDAELEKPPFSKLGDLWHLGRHTLLCGDSTKTESFERLLGEQKVQLVVTDPPYLVDYEGSQGKIKNDALNDEEGYKFLRAAFENMHAAMANDASIYVFHSDIHGHTFRRAFLDAGFYLSGCCIWKKQSLVLGRSPYQWQHEPCLYGWKVKGKHKWFSDRKQTTIWEFDKPRKNTVHSTMKPIPLMCYPISKSSMTGTRVLDPFGGSGSTLIACEQLNRGCFMIELDEKFCDVIVNRYIEFKNSCADVYLERDSQRFSYEEIVEDFD